MNDPQSHTSVRNVSELHFCSEKALSAKLFTEMWLGIFFFSANSSSYSLATTVLFPISEDSTYNEFLKKKKKEVIFKQTKNNTQTISS